MTIMLSILQAPAVPNATTSAFQSEEHMSQYSEPCLQFTLKAGTRMVDDDDDDVCWFSFFLWFGVGGWSYSNFLAPTAGRHGSHIRAFMGAII